MTMTFKTTLLGSFAALLLGASMSASAGFSGSSAVGDGTCSNSPAAPQDGTVPNGTCTFNSITPSLTIVGANNGPFVDAGGSPSTGITEFSFPVNSSGDQSVSGEWSYSTVDDFASFDPAGYFIDSVLHQLTTGSLAAGDGAKTQSGSFAFTVLAGQVFGYYVMTNDGQFGAATLTITDGGGTVPEPGSLVLVGLGLIGLAGIRRRKQSA